MRLENILAMREIIKPFANIYEQWLNNNLDDELRRKWGKELEHENDWKDLEVVTGRGGNVYSHNGRMPQCLGIAKRSQ